MGVGAGYGRSSIEGIKFPTVPHRKSTGFGSIGINFPVVKGIVNVDPPQCRAFDASMADRNGTTRIARHRVRPHQKKWEGGPKGPTRCAHTGKNGRGGRKVPPGEPDRNTWQEWSMYHTPQKRHDDKSSIPL